MKKDERTYHLQDLDTMSFERLDSILRVELDRDNADSEVVLRILEILERRDLADGIGGDVDLTAAWDRYQRSISAVHSLPEPNPKCWRMRMTAAVAAVVCAAILLAPPVLGTENIFTLIGCWTDDIFKFIDPTNTVTNPYDHYVFKTDHPGLQQIYDAVVELGIMEPVVPMWVPEGYVLKELKSTILGPGQGGRICAKLSTAEDNIIITIRSIDASVSVEYQKEKLDAEIYELWSVEHFIVRNKENLCAIWVIDDVECCISVSGQETHLRAILQSIYRQR